MVRREAYVHGRSIECIFILVEEEEDYTLKTFLLSLQEKKKQLKMQLENKSWRSDDGSEDQTSRKKKLSRNSEEVPLLAGGLYL